VAARGANFALQNLRFLLAIGVRLDFAITGYAPHNLAAKRIRQRWTSTGRNWQAAPAPPAAICAGAKEFLKELLRQKQIIRLRDHSAWDARCADWKTRYPVVTEEHRTGQ